MVSQAAQQFVNRKALSYYRDHLVTENDKCQAGLSRNGKARATAEDDARDTSFKHELEAIDALLEGLVSINSPLIPQRTFEPQPETLTVFRAHVGVDREPYINPFTGLLVVPQTPDAPGPSKSTNETQITLKHPLAEVLSSGIPSATTTSTLALAPESNGTNVSSPSEELSAATMSSLLIPNPTITSSARKKPNRWKRLPIPPDKENDARISAWNSTTAAFKSAIIPTNGFDAHSIALSDIKELLEEEARRCSDTSKGSQHDPAHLRHHLTQESISNNSAVADQSGGLSPTCASEGQCSTDVTAARSPVKAVTDEAKNGPSLTEPVPGSMSPRLCVPAVVKGPLAAAKQTITLSSTLNGHSRIGSSADSSKLAVASKSTSPTQNSKLDKNGDPSSSLGSFNMWPPFFTPLLVPSTQEDDRWQSRSPRSSMLRGLPLFQHYDLSNPQRGISRQTTRFPEIHGSQVGGVQARNQRGYDSGSTTERVFYDREQEYRRVTQQQQSEHQVYDENIRAARRRQGGLMHATLTRATQARAAETSRQLRDARQLEESEALARRLQAEFDQELQTLAESEALARRLQEAWDAEVASPDGRGAYYESPYTRDRLRSRSAVATSSDPYRPRSIIPDAVFSPQPPRVTNSHTSTTGTTAPLTDCTVCLNPFPTSTLTTLPCTHPYCPTCLTSALVSSLANKPPTPFICCPNSPPLPFSLARPFLPTPQHATKYTHALTLSSDPSPLYCSSPSCAAYIPPSSRPTHGNRVRCRECSRETCLRCKKRSHGGLCEKDENELRMEAMVRREGWRKCPGCGVVVERRDGCMHMTCRCRVEFCYGCGGRWGRERCLGGCGRGY